MSSTLNPAGILSRLIGVALFSPTAGPTAVGRLGKVGASGCATFAVNAPPGCAESAAFFPFPPLPFFAAFGAGLVASAASAIVAASSATTAALIQREILDAEEIMMKR